jgi:hypothetical protein
MPSGEIDTSLLVREILRSGTLLDSTRLCVDDFIDLRENTVRPKDRYDD